MCSRALSLVLPPECMRYVCIERVYMQLIRSILCDFQVRDVSIAREKIQMPLPQELLQRAQDARYDLKERGIRR